MRFVGIIAFAAGFALAGLATALGISRALDHFEVEALESRLRVAAFYRDKTEALGHRPPDEPRVVFLGDSMVASYPREHQVPVAVQNEINRITQGRSRIRVKSLAMAGTSVFDYYFLADVISRTDPELIVIPFNLSSPSHIYRAAFSRPELAGWTPTSRISEAMLLPINWIGLTADRLLLNRAIVGLGLFDMWLWLSEEQTRFSQARGRVEAQMDRHAERGRSPVDRFRAASRLFLFKRDNLDNANRFSATHTEALYGVALRGLKVDHPALVFLAASIRAFADRGIDTFVYVTPANMDHIRNVGLENSEGMARSLWNLETVIRESGATFADLHRIFPDAMFRDQTGHLNFEGEFDGPRGLAGELAPLVIERLRNRRSQEAKGPGH